MMWTSLLLVAACLLGVHSQTQNETDSLNGTTAAVTVPTDALTAAVTTPTPPTTTVAPITPAVMISEQHNSELGYTFSWTPVGVVTDTTVYTVSYSDGSTPTTVLTEQTAQTTVGITFPDYATSYVVTVTAKAAGSTESSPATKRIVTMPSDPTSSIAVTQSTAKGRFTTPGTNVLIVVVVVSGTINVDPGSMFTASNLNPGAQYSALFRAKHNMSGGIETSSPDRNLTYTTLEIPSPLEESSFTISPMSNSIKVQWTSDAVTDRIVLSLDDLTGACLDQKSYNCSDCGIQVDASSISLPNCGKVAGVSFIAGQSLTVEFLSLSAATNYTLSIVAETTGGRKNVIDSRTVRTTDSAPGKPLNLTLTAYNITQNVMADTLPNVNATWQRPAMTNERLSQYTVTARDQNGAEDVTVNVTDSQLLLEETLTLTIALSPLKAYTTYSVTVTATGETAGEGPPSDAQQITTQETVPTTPQNIVVAPNLLTANVTWDPPESPNGIIIEYRVRVLESDTQVFNTTVESKQTGNTIHIDGLESNTDYQLFVSGWTIYGEGDLYQGTFKTKQVPSKVKDLSAVLDPSTKVVRMTWSVPELPNDNTSSLLYSAILFDSKGMILKPICQLGELVQRTCNLPYSHLSGGLDYYVEVTVWNSFGLSDPESTGSFSVPAVPQRKAVGVPLEPTSEPTTSTITFQIPHDLFEKEDSGADIVILSYVVLVVDNSKKPDLLPSATIAGAPKLATWKESYDSGFARQYAALDGMWPGGNRKKRATETSITIGSDGSCNGDCNGPLGDNKQYCISLRVFTRTNYLDTDCLVVAMTKLNLIPIVVPLVVVLVVVIIVVVVFAYLWYKKRISLETCKKNGTVERVRSVSHPPQAPPLAPLKTSEPMRIRDFHTHVEKMHRDSNFLFAEEYRMLKESSPDLPKTAATQNASKNRYVDILPFDHSRVKLKITGDEDQTDDYINANFLPGFNSKREFIAAQGPLPGTIDDFWHMVWDQNVTTIVMLTNLVEKGKRKCELYWPEKVEENNTYGNIVITMRSESDLPEYIIRLFDMEMGDQRRTVKQFFYTKWPDWGCPDTPDTLINFVQVVRSHLRPDSTGPMVVHCSAGVGRTGTFVAVDHILQHIRQHDVIDVFKTVREMRGARCRMVQTEDQFIYVHDCIASALDKGMSPFFKPPPVSYASPEEDEIVYENSMQEPDYVNMQPMGQRQSVKEDSRSNGAVSAGFVHVSVVDESDSEDQEEEDDQM